MLINKNTRIVLIVLTAILILITGVSIYQGIYYSDNNVAKRFLNNTQEKYNVKLPQEINVEYKYLDSAIDGSNTYFVLTIQEDYELSYEKQYDNNIEQENYQINIQKSFDELKDYVDNEKLPTFNFKYDWFAREEKGETRYYNFYVVYDLDNKLMYLYYEVAQYKTYN